MNEVVNRGVRLGNSISHNTRCGIDGRDGSRDRKPAGRPDVNRVEARVSVYARRVWAHKQRCTTEQRRERVKCDNKMKPCIAPVQG